MSPFSVPVKRTASRKASLLVMVMLSVFRPTWKWLALISEKLLSDPQLPPERELTVFPFRSRLPLSSIVQLPEMDAPVVSVR